MPGGGIILGGGGGATSVVLGGGGGANASDNCTALAGTALAPGFGTHAFDFAFEPDAMDATKKNTRTDKLEEVSGEPRDSS